MATGWAAQTQSGKSRQRGRSQLERSAVLQPLPGPSRLSTSTGRLPPGLPSTRKVNLQGSLPPQPGRQVSGLQGFQAARRPPRSLAYLAQEVDIVEGRQKCGGHFSGSRNGRSCKRGVWEEPSVWRGPARAKTNNGRGAGRDGKFACGAEEEGGGRGVGGRGEARAQLGAPARPPREPTAARGPVELRGPGARALYRAEPRSGGAKRTGEGTER